MIAALQERPWPIHAYALIALGVGLDGYIGALYDLTGWELAFADMVPQFGWNRDWTIVTLSARFSIVCIPVAAIWIWGARLARTLVTAFTVLLTASFVRALAQGSIAIDPVNAGKTLALLLACALLFAPSSNRWLQPKKEKPVAEVFE